MTVEKTSDNLGCSCIFIPLALVICYQVIKSILIRMSVPLEDVAGLSFSLTAAITIVILAFEAK